MQPIANDVNHIEFSTNQNLPFTLHKPEVYQPPPEQLTEVPNRHPSSLTTKSRTFETLHNKTLRKIPVELMCTCRLKGNPRCICPETSWNHPFTLIGHYTRRSVTSCAEELHTFPKAKKSKVGSEGRQSPVKRSGERHSCW